MSRLAEAAVVMEWEYNLTLQGLIAKSCNKSNGTDESPCHSPSTKFNLPCARHRRRRADCGEGVVHQLDGFVNVALGDVHRRRHPDHVAVKPALADQQSLLAALFHELSSLFH